MDYESLMAQARKTNTHRDGVERKNGLIAPSDATPLDQLRTAMSAIRAGIITDDWNAVAEGQDMLVELEKRVVFALSERN